MKNCSTWNKIYLKITFQPENSIREFPSRKENIMIAQSENHILSLHNVPRGTLCRKYYCSLLSLGRLFHVEQIPIINHLKESSVTHNYSIILEKILNRSFQRNWCSINVPRGTIWLFLRKVLVRCGSWNVPRGAFIMKDDPYLQKKPFVPRGTSNA